MPLTFLDLFCGCGGFSLGMGRAGWHEAAAIDLDPAAIKVFKANLDAGERAFERDLTTFRPAELAELTGITRVDAIVGGPPCQGFSHVRQRDGSNSGPRQIADGRRYLYQQFLEYVQFLQTQGIRHGERPRHQNCLRGGILPAGPRRSTCSRIPGAWQSCRGPRLRSTPKKAPPAHLWHTAGYAGIFAGFIYAADA